VTCRSTRSPIPAAPVYSYCADPRTSSKLNICVSPYPECGPAATTPSRTCSVTGTTLTAEIAFDLDGGFLYGTVQISSSHPATGPVTGETGSFAAATGTIAGTV